MQIRLDILREDFARHSAWAVVGYGHTCEAYALWLSYILPEHRECVTNRVTVSYPDWHTIEWLSQETKEAILFLLLSEELTHNFDFIRGERAFHDRENLVYLTIRQMSARAKLVVSSSCSLRPTPHTRYFVHNEEDMGGGYVLDIRRSRIGTTLPVIFMGIGAIVLIPAILLLRWGIFALRREKEAKRA